jgi:hypothetical protein
MNLGKISKCEIYVVLEFEVLEDGLDDHVSLGEMLGESNSSHKDRILSTNDNDDDDSKKRN